jgi:hypothetical protein
MKRLVSALGWLAVGAGWFVGIVGVGLTATGFFAIIGLPLVALAVGMVTLGMSATSPAEVVTVQVPVRERPRLLRVVGARGGCPRGFRVGDSWWIEGKAMPALCQPALVAVNTLLEQSPDSGETPAACHCPLGDYQLTFALQAA